MKFGTATINETQHQFIKDYKEALENIKDKDLHQYGFLGYPVLQTADIVMYGEPEQV